MKKTIITVAFTLLVACTGNTKDSILGTETAVTVPSSDATPKPIDPAAGSPEPAPLDNEPPVSGNSDDPGAVPPEDAPVAPGFPKPPSDPTLEPDYAKIFNNDYVRELTINLGKPNFDAMQRDMTDIVSKSHPEGGINPQFFVRDPIWVNVSFNYEGQSWTNVGMRYKGNSSLNYLWRDHNRKLPFKINIDKFVGDSVAEQKFYGFKKLSFSPNAFDNAQIRDAFVSDLLTSQGIPVARYSFVKVFVDKGEGPQYWGLYTMLEEIDDGALLKREFGSKKGNLYKPESSWQTFDQASFIKANNEKAANWSDVQSAVGALLETGPGNEAWRAKLESFFNVQGFLKWLAVNKLLMNWDTYGVYAHNYYLYADPSHGGRLNWIPWDHNLALMNSDNDLFYAGTSDTWPLIKRLLADPIYKADYTRYLGDSVNGLFAKENAEAHLQRLHDLIVPAIAAEEANSTTVTNLNLFESSLNASDGIFNRLDQRRAIVKQTLGQ